MKRVALLGAIGWMACHAPPPAPPAPPEVAPPAAVQPPIPPEPEVSPPQVTPPLSVAVSSTTEGPEGSRRVGAVREVSIHVELAHVTATTQVAVEFFTPDAIPFEVQRARARAAPDDLQRLTFTLPVAGTLIDSSMLTGRWNARVLVDGNVAADHAFELEP